MKTIPRETKDCQEISFLFDSATLECTSYLSTEEHLYTSPFESWKFNPYDLYYHPDEFDHPNKIMLDPGVAAILTEDGKIEVPVKEQPLLNNHLFDGREFLSTSHIRALGDGVKEPLGFLEDTVITIDLKPGDLNNEAFKFYVLGLKAKLKGFLLPPPGNGSAPSPGDQANQELKSLTQTRSGRPGIGKGQAKNFPDQDGSQVPEIKKPDLRILPAPEKPKETRKKTPFPSEWKKQYTTSIIQKFLGTWHFNGLPRGAVELFWILIYFSRGPGKGHLTRYVIMGVNQMASLMEIRKSELLALTWGKERKEIEKMGTDPRTIQRHLAELLKSKLQIDVRRGEKDWQVSKRILSLSPGQAPHFNLLGKQAEERHKRREAKRIKTLKKHQGKPKPETL